jgi:DNA-binding LacI/PurR family transcriptional regulator
MTGGATGATGATPPTQGKTPVMGDVARLAGVSHQTVSRVINGQTNLRPATRQRVEEAIRQLGYRPNSAARALVTRRSGTIGVIGTKGGFWGPSTVHRTIQAAARDAGFFVSSVNLPDVTRKELADAVDHLRDQAVEGVVLIVANDEALEVARAHSTGEVPVVVVEGDLSRARWTVGVDQVAGAAMATEHLLELGHREILHVAGPQHWVEARARLIGWRTALVGAGLRPAEPLFGDWTASSGYAAGRELARRDEVSAVFVANDHMAIGVLRALSEAGRSVPLDVSVVGFDDIPESGFLIPPLTTIRQDFAAVGRRAIEILQLAIREGQSPSEDLAEEDRLERLISPELVIRASTAPLEDQE